MRRITILTTSLLVAATLSAPAVAGGPDRADVLRFADEQPVEGAVAQLNRTNSGIGFNIRTSELGAGHAVSIWWVIFNNPDGCANDPCGIGDLFVDLEGEDFTPNPDVNPAVQSGGGNVVGDVGVAGFGGHLREGQVTTEHPLFVGGPGLVDAQGAEVHLVVRSHGPKIPGQVKAQISSFEGGCELFLDAGVEPVNEGECADVQFAIFQ